MPRQQLRRCRLARARLAKGDLSLRTRDIVRQVREAYAMLGVTRQAIDTYIATAEILREFADIAQVKYATGRISQQDVLEAALRQGSCFSVE